ncbi:MAG: ADP-ribosylglycohydrolase family protein [Deltaproteobacteria bacterium]|nr:ADP-ribosylglycohydrolase family protein [Deltaproteobacteria bacterium]MBW2305526.1 ADP-ribosylglycohydrolase family protein [Deltaproteobacteria bacterium]
METISAERVRDRFAGAALGTFVGDALGMAVEGWSPALIHRRFGRLETMEPGRFPKGYYTDDTEMMIGILECLAEVGRFDPDITARNFLTNFHPDRGYGNRIYGIMARLAQGEPWDRVGTDSFGNGSAMRVAPIGFFFHDDPTQLKEAALLSSRITHFHPRGLAGAAAQASAVGLAVRHGVADDAADHRAFCEIVAGTVEDVDAGFARAVMNIPLESTGDLDGDIELIRERFACDVTAIGAVPAAIAAFLLTDDFRGALILAVNLGGDADTVGAMTGAIAGGYYGMSRFPREWVDELENNVKGRDYVIALAQKCAMLHSL